MTLISRSIVGLLLCDVEAGELDIGLVWWYKAVGSTSMTYSLCRSNTTRRRVSQCDVFW